MNHPQHDGERRRRGSPEFERDKRKRVRLACAVGIIGGALVLAEGVNAMRNGTMVIGGAEQGFLPLPGWIVAPMGLFVLVLSLWALVRSVTGKN